MLVATISDQLGNQMFTYAAVSLERNNGFEMNSSTPAALASSSIFV